MNRIFIGVMGSGKSICMQDCAREAVEAGWPVLAMDRAGEWLQSQTVRWRNHPPPIVEIHSMADFEVLKDIAEEKRMLPPAVYTFTFKVEAESVAAFGIDVGNVIFCDDEIDISAPINGKWKDNPMREYVHRGRHTRNKWGSVCELHLWGAGRRYQSIHTDVTSLAHEAFIFRVAGTHTIKRIVDELNFTPEQANEALSLPDLHYFRWSATGDGKGTHIARGYLTPLEVSKNSQSEDETDETGEA